LFPLAQSVRCHRGAYFYDQALAGQSVEIHLTLIHAATLAGIMLLGATLPSVSVLTVSARSATLGFAHGVVTSMGIVAGDMLYILIALYGLSLLAGWLGRHVLLIQYLGSAYLIWLGILLWRVTPPSRRAVDMGDASMRSSFLAGLLITLADQKAILFYLGVFPGLMDVSTTSLGDAGIILIIAVIAVGGPKIFYAYMAHQARQFLTSSGASNSVNRIAGAILVGVGLLLAAGAWSGW
jgi:threonine/homoserine/homoserine lactone efflux protein